MDDRINDDPRIDLEMQLLTSSPIPAENHESTARHMMQTTILFIQSVQLFLALAGSPPDHQDENARNEDIEDQVAVECPNADQTIVPLLKTVDNSWHSRKPIRTLGYIVRSLLAFRTYPRKRSASLPISSAHHVTIDQTSVNQITVDQLQRSQSQNIENLSMIVHQKNYLAFEEFGGLGGAELALSTDLINGISNDEALRRSRQQNVTLTLAPTHTFFDLKRSASLPISSAHHVTIDQTSVNQITVDQLQRSQSQNIENLSMIVHQKNYLAFEEFGGLGGAELALSTDLINGISNDEALRRSRQQNVTLTLAPTHTFFGLVREEAKKTTIILLLLAVILLTAFGINEEGGLTYGCYDEVVLLIAIILVVLFASIRKYLEEKRRQKKLQKHQIRVVVKRQDETKKIYKSELVRGDLVLLNKGDEVPCDGLFVGGEELLELDYGSESCIINQQNPFLSYGETVINGDARMVVTSTNTERDMGDTNTRFKLETQLDKLNTCMHVIQIVISILVLFVLAFRFMAGKIDEKNGNRPESIADPTSMRIFSNTFQRIIKQSPYTAKAVIRLLSVSLVGLTEGVPFVVSLAIIYWNDKTLLCDQATEHDPHCVAKMAFVTRICTDTFITEDEIVVEKINIGGQLIGELITPSGVVIDVLSDGIGTLKQKPFCRVKDKFRYNNEKRWKLIEMRGAKSLEQPCGVLMKKIDESEEMMWHFNGPVNKIMNMCKHYYDLEGHKVPLDDEMTQKLVQVNQNMEHEHQLITIAFACKPTGDQTQDVDDLILIALLGMKHMKKEDTNAQIKKLRDRRIKTVIVSSKEKSVVQDIALKCEVITNAESDCLVITGEDFRNYTDLERLEKVDDIRVLGEALASDKLLLVETMREKGEVVAYLGQRTDELPALNRANIGVAMGTCCSKKAIENCDIVIPDDCFTVLINMVNSGKCIYHNIQSFLQLVLYTTISISLISFFETAAFGDASITEFQLAWVTFTVYFLGGLALLTKPSTNNLARSDPISHAQSVITAEMTINILFQASYVAICSVIIQVKGSAFVGSDSYKKAVVSNVFIFCQIFNLFVAREQRNKNFFRGIHRHIEFWVAIVVFILLNAVITILQDIYGYGTSLKWKLWAVCLLLGLVSWLVDWIGKCIYWFINICVNRLRARTT